MRLLSLVLLVTLSYVSAQQQGGRVCIQGGPVPPECPNNNVWNSVTCRFECEPHCVSNEGNFVFPDPATGKTKFRQLCNECKCGVGGTAACTRMGCDSSLCWDDDGKSYKAGETLTRGSKTVTCTNVNGKGVWTGPNCPYGPAKFNQDTGRWDCPTTCQDGSKPSDCLDGGACASARCGDGTVCVENYCPNFPLLGKPTCKANCMRPVQCFADPCKVGQPKCGKGQVCEADYRFGCGYQCKDAPTCDFNGKTYQIGESRPSEDGCNSCGCTEHGWVCTLKACPEPTDKPICVQGGPTPAACPNNYRWNSETCKFECLPTEKPICVQGGPVPAECPDNNQWNPVTCKFECVRQCISNEGNVMAPGRSFYTACNKCSCGRNGISTCTLIACDFTQCYDDTGKPYNQGATITRGCKTGTCTKGADGQGVWKWVDPASQQPPRCDLAPAKFNKATCKWTCPNKCANGSNPPNCLVNPCATMLCAANTQCVVNSCPNFPNTQQGPCTATCQPIHNCLVAPCSVNSCGKGQTCIDDYVGGCNYRCKDKFRM